MLHIIESRGIILYIIKSNSLISAWDLREIFSEDIQIYTDFSNSVGKLNVLEC